MLRHRDAIYARYSSDRQNDATIEVQVGHCRQLAGPNPLEYIDKAQSGTTIHRRAFQQMIEDAEAGLFDRLIVYRFDRIGRNGYTQALCADIESMGIAITSVSEGDDPLSRGIHLVVGESFSRELGKKVRDSLELRFQRHTWTGGPPPFGYRIVHRDNAQYLTIDPAEAEIVRQIFAAYIGGTVGVKTIARRLMEKAVPTRHGAPWTHTSIRGVLLNHALIGEVRFGKRKMKRNRDTGRRVPVWNDPATVKSYINEELRIISDEDWAKVRAKLEDRRKPTGIARAGRHIRAFTGLIFCEECGNVYYCQKSTHGGNHFYTCGCRQRGGKLACSNTTNHREDKLLEEVLAVCSGIFDNADEIIRGAIKGVEARVAANRQDATRLRAEIAGIDKLTAGITRLLVDPEISKEAKGELQLQLQGNAAKRVPLQRGLDQMAERANQQTETMADWFRTALADARTSLETLGTPEGLRGFIERFVGPSVATRGGRLVK